MKQFKEDMTQIQALVGKAFTETGGLLAMADGGSKSDVSLQRKLEQTLEHFEKADLELRTLCEKYSPGAGQYGKKPVLPPIEVLGHVEKLGFNSFHIKLNTLLPHCRFQSPIWLSDTIRRLLDSYEAAGGQLPYFQTGAMLVIDERSDIDGRQVFDQDNKGWKAVSNSLKGRLIPDDDQYTLGITLLSRRSSENVCHIMLLDQSDAADFFSLRFGYSDADDVYDIL